jgi:hypothetical protein
MDVSKTALHCSFVSFRSGFRNVHSVLTVINVDLPVEYSPPIPVKKLSSVLERMPVQSFPNVIPKSSFSVASD